MNNFLHSFKNYLFPNFYEECTEIDESFLLSKIDEYHEVIVYDDNGNDNGNDIGNDIGRYKEHINVSHIIKRKHKTEVTLYIQKILFLKMVCIYLE